MINVDLSEAKPVETTITVDGGSFVLLLDRPTFEDRLLDESAIMDARFIRPEQYSQITKSRFQRRMERVVNWSGVNDPAGNAIPFSRESLQRLLSMSNVVADQVGLALQKVYDGEPLATPSVVDQASTVDAASAQ